MSMIDVLFIEQTSSPEGCDLAGPLIPRPCPEELATLVEHGLLLRK
jgi:hypothetical protein